MMGGDPALAALGDTASTQAIEVLREKWGLNEPILAQYVSFLGDLTRMDFGIAYSNNQAVSGLILRALPYSLALGLASIIGATIIGIPLGMIAAIKRDTIFDNLGRLVSLTGMSLPPFYVGVLFLLFFGLRLKWFPIMGAGDPGNLGDQLYHLVLPALAGALYLAAYVTRFVRSAMLEVLQEDYVRTARAKGNSERVVVFKHAFRNGLIPLVTVMGMYFAMLLGGNVLMELVFNRPGLGRLILEAIN